MSLKKFLISIIFIVVFLTCVIALIIKSNGPHKNTETAQFGPEKGVAMLSFYVQDGAKESETYYIEVTEKETYKWCYFHEDGEHIVKIEVPTSMVELIYRDDDLPHRMEVYLSDGKPVLYQIHLPNDANAIQLDKGND